MMSVVNLLGFLFIDGDYIKSPVILEFSLDHHSSSTIKLQLDNPPPSLECRLSINPI